MCRLEVEDIIHFLLKCPLLNASKQEPFCWLKNEVINNSEDGTDVTKETVLVIVYTDLSINDLFNFLVITRKHGA
jgi:hypothetical protein